MFTIQLIETNTGKPIENKKIAVGFDGVFRGFSKDKYTDKNGECHFDEDNGTGTIYVSGQKFYEGKIEGRKILYI